MQKTAQVSKKKTAQVGVQKTAQVAPDWFAAVGGNKPLFTVRDRNRRPFIKGPIPLAWIQQACRVNAGPLAIYIWWKIGFLSEGSKIALRPAELARFGLGRYSIRRQFNALVRANLVQPIRENGKCRAVRVVTSTAAAQRR